MATIKECLEVLGGLDGFVAACLVDGSSTTMLNGLGGGSVNLELAAAANSEVVRTKREYLNVAGSDDTTEDIVITLGRQYHLIRPLTAKDGLFLYLVMDRVKPDLASTRRTLARAESALVV